jgi:hypothetical protein
VSRERLIFTGMHSYAMFGFPCTFPAGNSSRQRQIIEDLTSEHWRENSEI